MKRFDIVLLLLEALSFIKYSSAAGYIYALPSSYANRTEQRFKYREADFGRSISPDDGLVGALWLAKPVNACKPVQIPQRRLIYPFNNFLLIQESKSQKDCSYGLQVLHAQKAGYSAAIIYSRYDDASLITMPGDGPVIPSVYVTKLAFHRKVLFDGDVKIQHSGTELKEYLVKTGRLTILTIRDSTIFLYHIYYPCFGFFLCGCPQEKSWPIETFAFRATVELVSIPEFPLKLYLVPFAVVVGICFFFMIVFSLGRFVRYRMRQRRSRLSPANLKKIPTKKFKKGDEYDMCAICIDEYEENDKIRILPCNHAYHCKCVDPWLTAGKKLCPVCKQSVEVDDKKKKKKKKRQQQQNLDVASTSSNHTESEPNFTDDTDDEDDYDNDDDSNERTPLLASQQNLTSSGAIDV